jgi:hypothetical protein
MLDNKRAQIGETMTWVVATIVIVVILIFSIFIVSFVKDESKEFKIQNSSDLLAVKSLSGYLLTQDKDGLNVYNHLIIDENLNDFNGNLALKIFKGFYEKDYGFVWLAIYSKPNNIIHNIFFPKPPPCAYGISNEIKLEENKYLLLTLTKAC